MTQERRKTIKTILRKARWTAVEAQCELDKIRDGKARDLIQELRRIQLLIAEYEETI